MHKINKWTFRYQWGGVQLAATWLANVGEDILRSVFGREVGRHHANRAALVVSVRDIQARPDSAYRMNWGASPVREYPIIQGEVIYPPSPLELAIRQNQQAGVNMVGVA